MSDHAAGAAAGSRRARRLAQAERVADDADQLLGVADEIESDRQFLLELMERERLPRKPWKQWLARVAEWAGLIKSNGRLFARSPSTSLVELEALMMGVTGKRALWRTLGALSLEGAYDFTELIARADGQLAQLEQAHARRAHVFRD